MSRVTLKDVARQAGVSPTTVSRYINAPGSIKPLSALRVERALHELDYIPNTFARGLKQGYSNNVGLIVPALTPFYSKICTALGEFFYQYRFLLQICVTHSDPEKEQYYIKSLQGQQVAGFVLVSFGNMYDYVQKLHKTYPNIVMVDHADENLPCDSVLIDNFDSSYRLTKYLLDKGYCRLSISQHPTYFISPASSLRIQGAKKAYQEVGLDFDENVHLHFLRTDEQDDFVECIRTQLGFTPRPDAIIAYSPTHLESYLVALHQLGLHMPDDIILAGYALNDFGAKYQLDIPSVIQDPYDMGLLAGDLLLKRIRKGQNTRTIKKICLPVHMNLPE